MIFFAGPSFWGLINPQWSLCTKGRRQSPINIEPDKLLFDRHLRPVHVDKHRISGHLHNTGQFLVFRADREAKIRVNITGGPLAYHYQFEEIYIHYGMDDGHGSEHRINNYAFPAEIQVYGFNAELYHNMSEAQHKSQGLVAISLMVQVSEFPIDESFVHFSNCLSPQKSFSHVTSFAINFYSHLILHVINKNVSN
ncbi:CAH10 protein, partial [Acromyrmex insinuator]